MGMIKNIKKRVAKRRESRQNAKSLGGSLAAQEKIIKSASSDVRQDRETSAEDHGELREATKDAQKTSREDRGSYQHEAGSQRLRLDDQRRSIAGIGEGAAQSSNILGNALATGDLRGQTEGILAQRGAGTESVLGQRAAAMAANPSYAQLANDAIAAQTQGVQDQTNFAQGQLARRAMGMAAGSGEGGALNAQQAMASLVGAGGDMAMQANLANQQNAAAQRAQAVMAQRGENVGEADYASQARMGDVANASAAALGAAGQERANQLGVAGKQADTAYQSGLATNAAQGALTGAGQALVNTKAGVNQASQGVAANLVGTQGQQALTGQDISTGAQTGLLTAGVNAAAGNEERSLARKIFTPFGMMGN